jgi:hypothetical protein
MYRADKPLWILRSKFVSQSTLISKTSFVKNREKLIAPFLKNNDWNGNILGLNKKKSRSFLKFYG